MLIRNSSLSLVFSKRSLTKSIASIGFMSARYLRNIHMRSRVVLSSNKSSRRVLDAVMLTAGKIRLLDRLRSSCNSMLPVPFKFFEDNFVHFRTGIDQCGSDDGQRAAVFNITGSTEETFRFVKCICIHTTGKNFTGCRRYCIVCTSQTGDRIKEDHYVVTTFYQTFCLFQYDTCNFT